MVFALKYTWHFLLSFFPFWMLFFLCFLGLFFLQFFQILIILIKSLIQVTFIELLPNNISVTRETNIKQTQTLSFSVHKKLRMPTFFEHLMCARELLICITDSVAHAQMTVLQRSCPYLLFINMKGSETLDTCVWNSWAKMWVD